MNRIQFIDHKGRKILHLDFSHAKSDEVLRIIADARTTIGAQPHKSVFTLTDVTETGFNAAVSEAMKDFVAHNKPFIAASAVVGVNGLKQIIFNAVMKFSGRQLHAFGSLAEAKDWLAAQ